MNGAIHKTNQYQTFVPVKRYLPIFVGILILAGLYISSFVHYLLFHTLVEFFTISIAFCFFFLAWNVRTYLINNFLRFLGFGYAFIAFIDLAHTLAYKGMNIFPGYGSNLPTQLWIAARYVQTVTLAVPLLFIAKRRLNDFFIIGSFTVVISGLLILVFSGLFPACYIEGEGLTPFKIYSEYVISAILFVSLLFLYRKRNQFSRSVFQLITFSIVCTIFSEISFTTYASVYGFMNLIGHLFKLMAFYFIYRAILFTGIREPFDLIFRELKQAEDELHIANDELEQKVAHRTAELEAANESLREGERKYRTLVENIPQKIYYKDRNSVYISVNKNFAGDFGIDPEDFVGKTDHDFFQKKLADKYRADDKRIMDMGKTEEIEEKYIQEGREVWVQIIKTPVRDDKGNVTGILGVFWDITQRKLAEEEIRNLNTSLEGRVAERTVQLEASNKELEAFSYSVSHDLRAPLRHINGYVDLLLERYRDSLPEKGIHYLDTVADSAQQMGLLIDDLLQFSRTGRQKMRQADIDMNMLFTEALESIKNDTEGRNIEWNIGVLPHVYGDHTLLRLVWINLLTNAVKFTRKNKKARIETGFSEENNEIIFFVRDNGAGFNMQYAQKLFGVFQRLHSAEEFEGTGIGLANVRRIISRHSGRTWAEGESDKGAVFYFTLPKNQENKP